MTKKKANKGTTPLAGTGVAGFDPLHQVAFWGLALLLFLPPYFRGLFFAPQQEKALIFALLVFWLAFLWRWLQGDDQLFRGPLDYLALSLPLVYIITALVAVNKGLAIDEVVKYLLYFLTYWSVARLVRHREDLHKLLHVIYASALGVALVGLAVATDLVFIKDGFLGGRIYSTFQYPNALASYLGAVVLIGFYLWLRSPQTQPDSSRGARGQRFPWLVGDHIQGYLYAGVNFLLLAVLFGTKSRGGLLVFGLVFLIYLAGLGPRGRLLVALHGVWNGALAYICVHQFILQALEQRYGQAWVWLLAGLLAGLAGHWLLRRLDQFVLGVWVNTGQKQNLAFGLLSGMVVLATGIFLLVKAELWEKVTDFSYLKNALERMYFVQDALKMIREKPLLGWGGGGWQEAYRSFQGYLYNSSEVHSYYFQVGVETGLLGLASVLGIGLGFGYYIFRIYRQRRTNRDLFSTAWVLAAAFLLIAVHAVIDFDLSLAALAIVLWSLLGLVAHLVQHGDRDRAGAGVVETGVRDRGKAAPGPHRGASVSLVAATVAVVLMLVPVLFLSQSHAQANQARFYLHLGQLDKATGHWESAVKYHPFNSDFRSGLAHSYRAGQQYEKSLAQARLAVQASPYNSLLRVDLARSHLALGQYQEAVRQAEEAVALAPFVQKRYDDLAQIYFEAGYGALGDRQEPEARDYFARAVQLPRAIQAIMDNLPEPYQKMWRDGPPLTATDPVLFVAGAAGYQLGDYHTAGVTLHKVAGQGDESLRAKVLVWLALVADKQGHQEQVGELLQKADQITGTARSDFEYIASLPVLQSGESDGE